MHPFSHRNNTISSRDLRCNIMGTQIHPVDMVKSSLDSSIQPIRFRRTSCHRSSSTCTTFSSYSTTGTISKTRKRVNDTSTTSSFDTAVGLSVIGGVNGCTGFGEIVRKRRWGGYAGGVLQLGGKGGRRHRGKRERDTGGYQLPFGSGVVFLEADVVGAFSS